MILPDELLWLIVALLNFAATLGIYRLFGRTGLYIWMAIAVITANIQVLKTVELFGLTATLGNVMYGGTFLLTDILSENHGVHYARRAVGVGFFALLAFSLMMGLALVFRPVSDDGIQQALVMLFRPLFRVTAASLGAYLLAQLYDIRAYDFWRRHFPNAVWLRNNASTLISQAIDSVIFTIVAFAGQLPPALLWEIALTTYIFKAVVALLDTPIIYLTRHLAHRQPSFPL